MVKCRIQGKADEEKELVVPPEMSTGSGIANAPVISFATRNRFWFGMMISVATL
jgi:hypothetical protein